MALDKYVANLKEPSYLYRLFGNEVHQRRVVHEFSMSDVEDPAIYVADPIHKWQQTEQGSWVMKHGKDPVYHMHHDNINWGYKVVITAYITPKRWTEYCLRFLDNTV